jgi:putative aldouronate transport system permease protein
MRSSRRGGARLGGDVRRLRAFGYAVVGLFALVAAFPFAMLLVNSFSSEHAILNYGYGFWPREPTTAAYELIFQYPQKMARTYAISVGVTAVGTFVSLFFAGMAAFVLSRPELRYRGALAFFLYFTQLFNGGLVPYYIFVSKGLHLQNSFLVLILVPMFSVMNILILRNFISSSVPSSLFESAKMDGAGEMTLYVQIAIPIAKPALASIGLLTALGYWNDWWTPMMFIHRESMYPLQYALYQLLSSINFAAGMVNSLPVINMPKESLKLAMTVVATGPMILAYSFVQRFFVTGITLGAVKG